MEHCTGVGKKEAERVERYAELAEKSAGGGTLAAPVLYEENDGVWLKLQGKDRKKHGADKEMKVGIAYDGVTRDAAKRRKELHNKVAYASFEDAKAFKSHKEGVVSHCFDTETVKLRVINGDGAQWIQKNNGDNSLSVLDAYHRNRVIGRAVKNPELAGQLRRFLYAGASENGVGRSDGQTGKRKPRGIAWLLYGKSTRLNRIL